MEWAIEAALATGKPVAATMCIGPDGDMHGVSTGECGVRMAKAGKRWFLYHDCQILKLSITNPLKNTYAYTSTNTYFLVWWSHEIQQ